MKVLLFNDRNDYDPTLPRHVRYSANSIITDGEKIAMIYVAKHNFYAFPGGGVDDGETIIDEAITANEAHVQQGYNWTEGIICVLNHLKDIQKRLPVME